jgi:hypothetical protein
MCSVKWWRPFIQWKRVPATRTSATGTTATAHTGTPWMCKTVQYRSTLVVLS